MSKRIAWLERFGYVMQKPTWHGMHNPSLDSEGGSRLHLVTHATKGINLDPLVAALNRLPPPLVYQAWNGVSSQQEAIPRRVNLNRG